MALVQPTDDALLRSMIKCMSQCNVVFTAPLNVHHIDLMRIIEIVPGTTHQHETFSAVRFKLLSGATALLYEYGSFVIMACTSKEQGWLAAQSVIYIINAAMRRHNPDHDPKNDLRIIRFQQHNVVTSGFSFPLDLDKMLQMFPSAASQGNFPGVALRPQHIPDLDIKTKMVITFFPRGSMNATGAPDTNHAIDVIRRIYKTVILPCRISAAGAGMRAARGTARVPKRGRTYNYNGPRVDVSEFGAPDDDESDSESEASDAGSDVDAEMLVSANPQITDAWDLDQSGWIRAPVPEGDNPAKRRRTATDIISDLDRSAARRTTRPARGATAPFDDTMFVPTVPTGRDGPRPGRPAFEA